MQAQVLLVLVLGFALLFVVALVLLLVSAREQVEQALQSQEVVRLELVQVQQQVQALESALVLSKARLQVAVSVQQKG